MSKPDNPSDIARETLTALATRKLAPTPENYALLAQLDQASRDLGFAEITAFDPRGRGAGDVAFVSPPLPGLDGLGLGGKGEHTVHESADLSRASELVKRSALLIYRLTR